MQGKRLSYCTSQEAVSLIFFCSLPVMPDSYSAARDALIKHFSPKKNAEFKNVQFRSARQIPSETADDFSLRVQRLAKHCSFGDLDAEIKTQIVQTCTLEKVWEKAVMERNMLWQKVPSSPVTRNRLNKTFRQICLRLHQL